MIKMKNMLVLAGVGAALCLGANSSFAQNGGGGGTGGTGGNGGGGGGGFQNWRNMSPEERQQAMTDRVKETLEVKDDTEWSAIKPLVQKVMEARMATMGGFGMGMRRNRGGGGGDTGGDQAGRGGGGGGMFGGQPNPEREALSKAIEAKASKAEIKAALAKYLESRKAKQADLEKAQDDLRKVLTSRQEAIAVVNGWL